MPVSTAHAPHVLHRPSTAPASRPPLLFVHGGYVDARCWDAHFLPWFAQRGYDCYALDLTGHGCSPGRERLDATGLDDFLADVLQVLGRLPGKPVIIGHSMGSYLAERVLERSLAIGGIFLSPLPPTGTLESAIGLFVRQPDFFCQVLRMSEGVLDHRGQQLIRQVYFSPTTPLATVVDFAHLVQPESARAIQEMALLAWRWQPPPPALPVLVAGGECDAVFPPYMVRRVARHWRAQLQIVEGAGHALILDQQWQNCAELMLGWLDRLDLPITGTLREEADSRCCA